MVDRGQHQPNIAFILQLIRTTLIILVYTSEKSSVTFVDKVIVQPICAEPVTAERRRRVESGRCQKSKAADVRPKAADVKHFYFGFHGSKAADV